MELNVVVSFSQRLKELRKKRGLSQTELASVCKLHPSHLSKFESPHKGNEVLPRADVLIKLAKALETTTDFLLLGSNSSRSEKFEMLFSEIDRLSEEDREMVTSVLEAILMRVKGKTKYPKEEG